MQKLCCLLILQFSAIYDFHLLNRTQTGSKFANTESDAYFIINELGQFARQVLQGRMLSSLVYEHVQRPKTNTGCVF